MFTYEYEEQHKQDPDFPYHFVGIMDGIIYNFTQEHDRALKAERERLCRNALRFLGVEGKLWKMTTEWNRMEGHITIMQFRESKHAALYKLML